MKDLLDRIKELKKKKSEVKKEAKKIKEDFENYITDQNIPLSERWDFFGKAPEDLSFQNSSIMAAESEGLIYVLDNFFTPRELYGRGQQIDTKSLFQFVFDDSDLNYDSSKHSEKKIALCKEAMEEILSENCSSFCLD